MKKLVLKKGYTYLLVLVNILIMMTLTNNALLTDFILLCVFVVNSLILLKFSRLN